MRRGACIRRGAGGFSYGPYVRMNAGEYTLIVTGAATAVSSAWVDVTSGLGRVQHARFALSPTGGLAGVLASGTVVLDEDVTYLEVRVYVGPEDDVRLDGFELVPVSGTPAPAAGN